MSQVSNSSTEESRKAREKAQYTKMEEELKKKKALRESIKSCCTFGEKCRNFEPLKNALIEAEGNYALVRTSSVSNKTEKTEFKSVIHKLKQEIEALKAEAKLPITEMPKLPATLPPVVNFNTKAAVEIDRLNEALCLAEETIAELREKQSPLKPPTKPMSTQTGWFSYSVQTQTSTQARTVATQTGAGSETVFTQTVEAARLESSTQTKPLDNLHGLICKLKFRSMHQQLWQKKYENAIKNLLRKFMRAAAKPKLSVKPQDPPSASNASPQTEIDEIRAAIQSETAQINRQLEDLNSELGKLDLDNKLNKYVENVDDKLKTLQFSIDELREEGIAHHKQSAADIKRTNGEVASLNQQLGQLRQSTFELENGLKTIPLETIKTELSILEASIKDSVTGSIKTDLLALQASIKAAVSEFMIEAQKFRSEEESRPKSKELPLENTTSIACQTGFDVNNYEYDSLLRAAEEAHKFSIVLPSLEFKAQEINLQLTRHDTIVGEAKELMTELKSITDSQLRSFSQAKRQVEDSRLVEIQAQQRARKISAKKAKIIVARNSVAKVEDNIKVELTSSVPKIASFIQEWNSLQKGDIVSFRGLHLEVNETFNPSIRIKHTDQSGDKWEAQKIANSIWYERGYTECVLQC